MLQPISTNTYPDQLKLLFFFNKIHSGEKMGETAQKYYLGVDVGASSTKLAVIDVDRQLIRSVYLMSSMDPIASVQKGIGILRKKLGTDLKISGVGITGSRRKLIGTIIGADILINENIGNSRASLNEVGNIKTIIEIGGQNSKLILLKNGEPVDIIENINCTESAGGFLDIQARRLNIPIDAFGEYALRAKPRNSISGRRTCVSEKTILIKQQMGYSREDIVKWLCESVVQNFLDSVGNREHIRSPIMFQGGVAANKGVRVAFKKALGMDVIVPDHFSVMGAIGAAIIAQEKTFFNCNPSNFQGWDTASAEIKRNCFECWDCPKTCEIVELWKNGEKVACWGGKCKKWEEETTPTQFPPKSELESSAIVLSQSK